MFNFERAISEWRQRMGAGGIKNFAVLDELESHLREDIERRTKAGMMTEKAFNAAVRKIGPASALAKEFRKTAVGSFLEKLMLAVAVLFLAFGVFLGAATIIFCHGSFGQRLMGFIAFSITLATACLWPRVIPYLPAIAEKPKRVIFELVCFFGGYGIAMIYVRLVVPHSAHSAEGILPAMGFWALFPIAAGLGLACGLERAAKKSGAPFAA